MALSLGSLHEPLAEFFVARFGSAASEDVVFRFDAFGSVLSEDDFVNPDDPTGGATTALALERVSDLANRVPRESGDGAAVVFTADSVDTFYRDRMLGPAQAYLPPSADAETTRALREQFEATKAGALREWDSSERASVTGSSSLFRPTEPTPTTWYDAGEEGWSRNDFTITDDKPVPNRTGTAPEPILWRAMPSPVVLERSLVRADVPVALRVGAVSVAAPSRVAAVAVRMPGVHVQARAAGPDTTAGRRRSTVSVARGSVRDHRGPRVETAATRVRDHRVRFAGFSRSLVGLDATKRLKVRQEVVEAAAATPTATDEMTVSFEYCVVRLTRRWWSSTLVSGGGWRCPGLPAGGLTDDGALGGLQMLPVAFVAVRRLSISARWSEADREQLDDAMSLGPFSVTGSAGDGTVTEPGLQVVGWILQRLPSLPPHPWQGSPGAVSPGDAGSETAAEGPDGSAATTYIVEKGDTLFAIATQFYGDGNRYPEIAQANGITDAGSIAEGQTLQVPAG